MECGSVKQSLSYAGTAPKVCCNSFPAPKQDIILQGHLSTPFPLQPRGKDLFPHKSPPVVSTELGTREYLQIPFTNNSQPVADYTFLTASH